MHAAPPPPSAAIPERIGPYRPRRILGRGGMATVYLAEGGPRSRVRGLVALKVPHASLSSQRSYMQMFLREAELASQIEHPHVCRVFTFGRRGSVAYQAMEYLRGRSLASLAEHLRPQRAPVRHAALVARLIADACEGLQAIHDHGKHQVPPPRVVHRDISPENLFLTEQGFIKIIDLGLAKVETARDKTAPGIVKGKLSYIAPELLLGQAATPRSDIWSLGVVTWELLTGKRLFHDKTDLGTVTLVRAHTIAPPSSIIPGLPKALDRIVLRALQRDPTERYRSAAEFAEALWAYLAKGKVIQHSDLAAWLREPIGASQERSPPRTLRDAEVAQTVPAASLERWSEVSGSLARWKSSRTLRHAAIAALGVAVAWTFSSLRGATESGHPAALSATTTEAPSGP